MMRIASRNFVCNLRLSLLVIEGYAYLLGTILVFAGVIAFFAWGLLTRHPIIGLLAVFVGLPAAMLTGAAGRALLFRVPEPHGPQVSSRETPRLISMVDELRQLLGSPRVHRIVIGTVPIASVGQIPRLVVLWPRNTLVIGFPLLLVLSPEQLRAVVAHELAHLSHAHGTVAGWVYRTRLSWLRLAEVLSERGVVPVFVRWLLATYLPRLEARSSEIAREQEAVADRRAADVVGTGNMAETLVAIELVNRFLKDVFWPTLFERISSEKEPPRPYSSMRRALAAVSENHPSAEFLVRLLDGAVESCDTHPCLRDRLRAIGEEMRVPQRPGVTAGDTYFGGFLQVISDRLDAEWQRRHGTEWRERHAKIRKTLDRIAELETHMPPSAEAAFERGVLLEQLDQEPEALRAYQAALEENHDHGPASLAAGRILLSRNDPNGAVLVERSMELDQSLVADACDILARYHEGRDQPADAQRYKARAGRRAAGAQIAQAEQETVTAFDHLAPHGLDQEKIEPLLAALRSESRVVRALLARKHFRHSSGSLFVLGIVARGAGCAELANRIRSGNFLGVDTRVVMLDRDQRALQSAIETLSGGQIYVSDAG